MKTNTRNHSPGGFALVITLTLLALLVLAVYALSALAKVNSRVSGASLYQIQARQNALLGMNRALGELQRLAGPDRRATATADIVAGRNDSKRYWTGVWDNTGAPLGWLVSGDNSSPFGTVIAATDRPLVTLVDANSAGSNSPAVQVQIESIDVSGVPGQDPTQRTRVGHFGYWIGDEGVKATAKFSETMDRLDYDPSIAAFVARDPIITEAAVNDATKRLWQMMLPRPRIEEISDSLNPEVTATRANLQRVQAFNQIAFAASSTLQLAAHFHDVTVESLGVLADPVSGGLKRDLSVPDAAEAVAGVTANAWLKIRPSSQSGSLARHRMATASQGVVVAPVLTEIGLRFRFFRSGATNAANGTLNVRCQMQVEFWNPSTSTLESDGIRSVRIGVAGLPTDLTVKTGTGQTFSKINLQAAFDHMAFQLPVTTTWAPGSISVFYGGGSWSATATTTAGLSFDFGQNIPGTTNTANRWISVAATNAAELTTPIVNLFYGSETLATYQPKVAFSAVNVAQFSPWTEPGGWQFGYGYAVRDSFAFWADGATDGALDPRAPDLSGNFVETSATAWRNDSSANATTTIARSSSGATGTTFYAASSGPVYPLFELPRQEVVSLGALQHVPGTRPNLIGNPWGGAANAVFDAAFLSALPRDDHAWTTPPLPLAPNAYLSLYRGATTPTRSDLLDETSAAAHLFVRGAFNVNSTSAKAWRVVLGGTESPADYTIGGTALTNAFFRHSHSAQENSASATKPTGVATARKQGVRDLSEDQVAALASAMAALNQARSRPYLSLQDFLNSGALDTALSPTATIAGESDSASRQGINGGATLTRGMPACLSQADVLTSIAPFIASRSDTFRIRAYGDAVNPAGRSVVEATALCEAIVQRTPDYVDRSQDATATSLNTTNARFGRRFKIMYFRWLGPDDI